MTMKKEQMKTLYDRLGGEEGVKLIIDNFFDELVEDRKVGKFFKDVPMTVLCDHQLKFFRVAFGPEEERPSDEKYWNYLLGTHARLFRDMGLDETHFDLVAKCFVLGLETMQVSQTDIDEAVALLSPLRCIFSYGARVAAKEKELTPEERAELPKADYQSVIDSNENTVLPDLGYVETPQWLTDYLGQHSKRSNVRAWTCKLSQKFAAQNDRAVADTFMAMPFMDLHKYLVHLLELAFLPEGRSPSSLIKKVRQPVSEAMSFLLWERLVLHFSRTCTDMGMKASVIKQATDKLLSYEKNFSVMQIIPANGIKKPHLLQKTKKSSRTPPLIVSSSLSLKDKRKTVGRTYSADSSVTSCSSTTSSNHSSGGNEPRARATPRKSKSFMQRVLETRK